MVNNNLAIHNSLALFQKRIENGKSTSGSCRVTQVICGSTCHMFLYSEVTKKDKRGAEKRLKEYCSDDNISVDNVDSCQVKRKKKKEIRMLKDQLKLKVKTLQ